MTYDLGKLNDREFETLGATVIEKITKKRVETFKAGRDGGVDGRFWIGKNKEGIIQCKHYIDTPYTTLISKLKSEELAKVKKLKPQRYIFITSKKLSRSNKQEIKKIFYPYIKREDDIFGTEDLTTFLSKKENQDVLEENYKLWITSTTVLDLLYNNAIKGRSESTIREIKENTYKYAITENHKKGLTILKEKNVIILTGEPGIGKTTLADNLALYFIAKGFEFCDIEEDISEAESIFRENEKKQILFYCDDFLGSNLYDAVSNKRDSHIIKFINRVRKDNSKKFILTSRTNILNKAFSLSHKFQNGKIRSNEFLLKVENLTQLDKAKILYNHIYHSNLEVEFIDKIYENKKYNEIVNHPNFNPRTIEFITDYTRVGKIKSSEYWQYVKVNLEKPEDIWADYFQNQTDDCVRALAFLTVYNKGKIVEEELRSAYNVFLKIHPVNLGDHSDKSFEAVRKLAIKSLLNRNQIDEDSYEYILFNPSIADFVLNSYSEEIDLISDILKSLATETSIDYFYSLLRDNKITPQFSTKVLKNLFEYFFEKKAKDQNWDFLISLVYISYPHDEFDGRIINFIEVLKNVNNLKGANLSKLLSIIEYYRFDIEYKDFTFLNGFIEDPMDEETLKELTDFVDLFNIDDQNILSQVKMHIESFVEDLVINNDLGIDYMEHLSHNHYPDGFTNYEVNLSEIESEVDSGLDIYLEELNANVLELIAFDSSSVVSQINFEDLAMNYMENYSPEYEPDYDREIGRSFNINSSIEDLIDAIFER